MVSARKWVAAGLIIACGGFVACAEGTAVENPATATGQGGGGIGGRGLGGAGGSDDDDVSSSSKSSSRSSSAATSGSTGSSSGDGGGGEGGAGDGGAGSTSVTASSASSSSGMQCNFTSPNQCATAESLGSIAGDEDGAPVILTGTTSKWYTIRIEERSSGISETDLSWRVSLTSPVGMNYDVIVHEGPQDGGVDCNGTVYNGALSGNAEVCSHEYDDDQGIGGEDDSLWLAIEVRYVSGEACGVLDTWQLTIDGYI
jgi:hypothetical protein